jgi:beta-1,2-mannobiose phosphorylase / 1,2-beta-oligomannan phosphorylase
MIPRLSNSLLLQPSNITPSRSDWKVIGVFNPAVAICDDKMFMLVRVAEQPVEERIGWTALPYWSMTGDTSAATARFSKRSVLDSLSPQSKFQ